MGARVTKTLASAVYGVKNRRKKIPQAVFFAQDDSASRWEALQGELLDKHEHDFVLYEQCVGLKEPNIKFRHLVSMAITSCVKSSVEQQGAPRGDAFKKLNHIGEVAAAIAENALTLQKALVVLRKLLSDRCADINVTPSRLANDAVQYAQFSEIARRLAKRQSDKGGASRMTSFRVLVNKLGRAFEEVTGRPGKVTRKPADDRYEGPFLALIEAVLPLAEARAKNLGVSLRRPVSSTALGKYVSEMTRAGRKRPTLYTA
jgi:hypothetical protein